MWGSRMDFTCCKCASENWLYSMFSMFATRCLKCRGLSQSQLYSYQSQFQCGLITPEYGEKQVLKHLSSGSIDQGEANMIRSFIPMLMFLKPQKKPQKQNGTRIAQSVAGNVEPASKGMCLKYVRLGIQKALNLPQQPIGIQSAKDAGPWLQKVGFRQVKGQEYQNGDVQIIPAQGQHKHGHIQVYLNGYWYSDFKQKTNNPWAGCEHSGVIYRR